MTMLTDVVKTLHSLGSFSIFYFAQRARRPIDRLSPGASPSTFIKHSTLSANTWPRFGKNLSIAQNCRINSKYRVCKEFGVWCVVGSPVWKPRDMSEPGGGGAGGVAASPVAAPTAPTTLPRSQRPAPRAHHLSASRKSLAPDHRH